MTILLVPGFMADETLWRDLEAPLARFTPIHHADLRQPWLELQAGRE